jgi:hypothetical protein
MAMTTTMPTTTTMFTMSVTLLLMWVSTGGGGASSFQLSSPIFTPILQQQHQPPTTTTTQRISILKERSVTVLAAGNNKIGEETTVVDVLTTTDCNNNEIPKVAIANNTKTNTPPKKKTTVSKNQRWERMFTLLKQFREREGHYDMPAIYIEDGKKLGYWIRNQRSWKKAGKLQSVRVERLSELDGFVWEVQSNKWEMNYKLLIKYKQRVGHCKVPQMHKEDGKDLGKWALAQRTIKKKGGTFDSMRENRLDELGFVWSSTIVDEWDSTYKLLTQFKEEEGHCNVPRTHNVDGKNLGKWVNTQRTGKNRGTLDVMRQKRLEGIDFNWAVARANVWEDYFSLLENFKQREGHCNVPILHKVDELHLGHWLNKQKQNWRKGELNDTRITRLFDLGVVLNSYSTQWDYMYNLLVQFKEREGNCNVSLMHKEDEKNLGTWLITQRSSKKKGKLPKDRQNKLDEIGVVW